MEALCANHGRTRDFARNAFVSVHEDLLNLSMIHNTPRFCKYIKFALVDLQLHGFWTGQVIGANSKPTCPILSSL